MLVEAWLARAAAARPEHLALQTPSASWRYRELHGAALAGAAELLARGAGPGVPVAIALPPGLEFAQALHACLLTGAVAVPIDLRQPAAARAKVASRAELVVEE